MLHHASFISLKNIRVSQQGCCPSYLVAGSASEALHLVIVKGHKVFVELGDVGVHEKLGIRTA